MLNICMRFQSQKAAYNIIRGRRILRTLRRRYIRIHSSCFQSLRAGKWRRNIYALLSELLLPYVFSKQMNYRNNRNPRANNGKIQNQ